MTTQTLENTDRKKRNKQQQKENQTRNREIRALRKKQKQENRKNRYSSIKEMFKEFSDTIAIGKYKTSEHLSHVQREQDRADEQYETKIRMELVKQGLTEEEVSIEVEKRIGVVLKSRQEDVLRRRKKREKSEKKKSQ